MIRAILLTSCILFLASGGCIELQQAMGPGNGAAAATLSYGPVVEQADDEDTPADDAGGDETEDGDTAADEPDDSADDSEDTPEDDPADTPEDEATGPEEPTDDPAIEEPVDDEPLGAPPELAEGLEEVETATGLKYIIIQEGTGATVVEDDSINAHYDGYLEDGTVFDSSRERNSPFTFQVGLGQVIDGWDEGFVGMTVGEQRRLIIPPDLAYGESGRPPTIPPSATLIFDVEVLEIN